MVKKLREHMPGADRLRPEMMAPSSIHPDPAPIRARRNPARSRKFSLRRAGYALFFGISALAAIGVPMNALFFQDARHPAPMFLTNSLISTAPAPSSARATAARNVEKTSTSIQGSKSGAETELSSVKSENPRHDSVPTTKTLAHQALKTEEPRKHDSIADLLNGNAMSKTPAESDVLMAQRALLKLGYVVRADGKFTKATQKAIEKFEHDNGIQVKGLLTTKIAAMLASRAGLESE